MFSPYGHYYLFLIILSIFHAKSGLTGDSDKILIKKEKVLWKIS